jgi:uncharacterized protein (DUF2237 family)
METNVFGEPLTKCGTDPVTGFTRNGCCDSSEHDPGLHILCAVMTDEFLDFSYLRGNDLKTPYPDGGFPGLKAGDRWCLCAARWLEALEAGVAPPVVLEGTNEKMLEFISLEELVLYAFKEYGLNS